MNMEETLRHFSEHVSKLVWAHRRVGAERREDSLETVSVEFPSVFREVAGARVFTALIGRDS
jgi:hypothetical protein